MREVKVFDFRMNDGSRKFVELPEIVFFDRMREHVGVLDGAVEKKFVTDGVTEMWLDFEYRGHHFSINNQMGDYWFFVEDVTCPDCILAEVVDHFSLINPK